MRSSVGLLAVIGGVLILTILGCTSSPRYTSDHQQPPRREANPTRRIPTPTTRPPTMKVRPGAVFVGVSSFYGPDFHGKLTANGEVYDMYGLTAAHRTLPLNTIIRVTNMRNKRSLIVRINDRGPYIEGRMLDLSYGAAKKLDFLNHGTTRVRIEVIEVGDDEYMEHLPEPQRN